MNVSVLFVMNDIWPFFVWIWEDFEQLSGWKTRNQPGNAADSSHWMRHRREYDNREASSVVFWLGKCQSHRICSVFSLHCLFLQFTQFLFDMSKAVFCDWVGRKTFHEDENLSDAEPTKAKVSQAQDLMRSCCFLDRITQEGSVFPKWSITSRRIRSLAGCQRLWAETGNQSTWHIDTCWC